ncbi:MAG TPA: hypothetical protein PK372_06635 [Rugosibacter sp.]|nr:hypothetical protein [Rugosibacter sp.]HQQ35584.1 hypothetical protein [Rugosibacter sp.]
MNLFADNALGSFLQMGTEGGQMRLNGQRMILFYASAFTEY